MMLTSYIINSLPLDCRSVASESIMEKSQGEGASDKTMHAEALGIINVLTRH